MWPNLQFPAHLVTITEEILMENFIFYAACAKPNNARLPLHTNVCFWATLSPTYDAYVIFFAN